MFWWTWVQFYLKCEKSVAQSAKEKAQSANKKSQRVSTENLKNLLVVQSCQVVVVAKADSTILYEKLFT